MYRGNQSLKSSGPTDREPGQLCLSLVYEHHCHGTAEQRNEDLELHAQHEAEALLSKMDLQPLSVAEAWWRLAWLLVLAGAADPLPHRRRVMGHPTASNTDLPKTGQRMC